MATKLSFLHAADLHLDSPFKGLANVPENIFKDIRESTFLALDRLVSQAISLDVDFILLAGDLFDNERQSLQAQVRLRNAFEILQQHGIPVYLSYGNHDFMQGNIHPIAYPDNVSVFPDEQVRHFVYTKNGKPMAAVYGFSYEQRAVHENKIQQYNVANQDIPYHIAMLHGSLQSNTAHDTYAPFQISDMTKKDFDYWALGHIHKREILHTNPPIVYPGNTQGRSAKETGMKGCYHVMMEEGKTSLEFVPLANIVFQTMEIDITECRQIHQLENLLLEQLEQVKDVQHAQLIALKLTTENKAASLLQGEQLLQELVDIVNEQLEREVPWQYIYQAALHVYQQEEVAKGRHFAGELAANLADASVQPYVRELYGHKAARKFLPAITPQQEQRWKEKAQQLLLQEILQNRG
ncbi:DNA repair exonuclease [Virgibacillus sp. 179-BFC.A HS]|uniref:DNA repair exonuclease n=1 Tax=Tigheibacillus jepli TaxID=3035914 RepID=A0ABU5CLA4_9BACI|nr:DNA repair exonuclease [Virgibacillus sp. 179-BFC.A HS]MDY0406255.1 DNA repair exonuclease [Virgibacillus sp. 179-BFC.A HS]